MTRDPAKTAYRLQIIAAVFAVLAALFAVITLILVLTT